MKFVNEIGSNRFGIGMGAKVAAVGTPDITFAYNSASKLMTLTVNISFNVPSGQLNETGSAIAITPQMGDLLVADFGKTLPMQTPTELNFSYDSQNAKIAIIVAVPPGDKGNHSS